MTNKNGEYTMSNISEQVTRPPSEDAVGVARAHVESYRNPIAFSDDEFAGYLDALIAAVESRVRAECTAKVEGLQESHIADECSQCDSGFSCTARGVEEGIALALKVIALSP